MFLYKFFLKPNRISRNYRADLSQIQVNYLFDYKRVNTWIFGKLGVFFKVISRNNFTTHGGTKWANQHNQANERQRVVSISSQRVVVKIQRTLREHKKSSNWSRSGLGIAERTWPDWKCDQISCGKLKPFFQIWNSIGAKKSFVFKEGRASITQAFRIGLFEWEKQREQKWTQLKTYWFDAFL